MKSVLLGIGLMIVVSVVAWAVLSTQSVSSRQEYSSHNGSVRLD